MKLLLLTLMFALCGFAVSAQTPTDKSWKQFAVCSVIFSGPADLTEKRKRTIDTCKVDFVNPDITVGVNVGNFGLPSKPGDGYVDDEAQDVKNEWIGVDGRTARLTTYFVPAPKADGGPTFFHLVYVLNKSGSPLLLYISSKSKSDNTAKHIIESLKVSGIFTPSKS
jgi:hypothetical protein